MTTTIASVDVGGTGLSTVGTNGQVLTSNGMTLSWVTPSASTLTGTLGVANGGTGTGSVVLNSNPIFSGNIGIGVTPSAWQGSYNALQIGSEMAIYNVGSYSALAANYYVNSSGNATYIATDFATGYQQNRGNGGHYWYTGPSGTAGTTATLTNVATLNNAGTLTFNVSGQGIQFSNSSALTNSTLNDYETGAWTPNQGSGLSVVGTFISAGTYTKIGRLVFVNFRVSGSTSVTVSNIGLICSNLPFSVAADGIGGYGVGQNNTSGIVIGSYCYGTGAYYYSNASTTATAGYGLYFTVLYEAIF
jgi:hypothetical protein